ncbi:keratin, type II cytoskeletal 2 epidermal-like [Iris pallida]|uniref:Keratin, type II cytoskeletal 2 epidermal-like n=1 Tax=Iris pallida TaxID=29817 RepID=A0AAX6GRW2_IRIPA|nr:keratin, type II cytoskeletal 2 epidermal-like [Iris pallida]
MMIDRSPGSLSGIRIAAFYNSISCVRIISCVFTCWVSVNWLILDSRTFRELFGGVGIISVVRKLFWWIYVDYLGWKLFAGICWRTSQFWVCPGIGEVLPKFLQNYIFY